MSSSESDEPTQVKFHSDIVRGILDTSTYRFKTGEIESLNLLKNITTILDLISDNEGNNPISDFIHNKQLRWDNFGISAPGQSASGVAIAGLLSSKPEPIFSRKKVDIDFVIKFHNKSKERNQRIQEKISEEIFHEYNIGLITNILRAICPNFAMMLGLFECDAVWRDLDGGLGGRKLDSITFCGISTPTPKTKFLVYESVKKPQDLSDYLIRCFSNAVSKGGFVYNSRNGLLALYQALCALSIAEDSLGWYHQDEHFGNILVSPLIANGHEDGEDLFTYVLDSGSIISFETDVLVSLIDYGRTSVQRPEFPKGCSGYKESWPDVKGHLKYTCGGLGSPAFGKCQFMSFLFYSISQIPYFEDDLGNSLSNFLSQFRFDMRMAQTFDDITLSSGISLGRALMNHQINIYSFAERKLSIFDFNKIIYSIQDRSLQTELLGVVSEFMIEMYGVDIINMRYESILSYIHENIMEGSTLYTEEEVEDLVVKYENKNPKIFTFQNWFEEAISQKLKPAILDASIEYLVENILSDHVSDFYYKVLDSANTFLCYVSFIFQDSPGVIQEFASADDLINIEVLEAWDGDCGSWTSYTSTRELSEIDTSSDEDDIDEGSLIIAPPEGTVILPEKTKTASISYSPKSQTLTAKAYLFSSPEYQ